MLSYVYRSKKRPETYLYLAKRDQFDSVPEALLNVFGTPEFVFFINLKGKKQLARVDKETVLAALDSQGYFFQPPPNKTIDQLVLASDMTLSSKESDND
tara:strand:+ start:2010 stop:2306 length:297 start_codon:yes stop_codon:yes gene_type:complete